MSGASQYEFLILLVSAIVALELLARRIGLPAAAAFIIGGGVLALLPGLPTFAIEPDLIFLVFLPPLLMNGAYLTVWQEFRENLSGIVMLAIGAVAFTTLLVGLTVKTLAPAIPWSVCFAAGAIVSPPDAVAANAVLERLSLPGRLSALLQGESLLNDASGLVLFRFALAAALTGVFSPLAAVGSFLFVAIGGAVVGYVIGRAGMLIIRRLDDSELIITVTLLLAAISYVGGEQLHVSGVLATVTTGMLLGWHQHTDFSATTRIRAQAFWKVLVFLLESILFILIGLSLRGVVERVQTVDHPGTTFVLPVLGVVLVVVLSRFIWVFGTYLVLKVSRRLGIGSQEPSAAVATVMSWAGMRGVVALAAALSLPASIPGRDLVLVSAFVVILVTVLIQGTTLGPLIRLLRLSGPGDLEQRQASEDHAWKRMADAQFRAIAALSRQPDGTELHPRLVEQYGHRARVAAAYTVQREAHQPAKSEHFSVLLQGINAARVEVLRMHRAGEIHDRVLRDLEKELDLQQMVAESHA